MDRCGCVCIILAYLRISMAREGEQTLKDKLSSIVYKCYRTGYKRRMATIYKELQGRGGGKVLRARGDEWPTRK